MRRGLAAAVAVGALAAPQTALADEQIRAITPNTYENPNVEIDQGERLTFLNLDFARHDVTALDLGPDRKPLFSTPLIGQNEEVFVEGSQYLKTGVYEYVCTIHSNMVGKLRVNSMGTPVPRPGGGGTGGGGGGGAGDRTKPRLSMRVADVTRSAIKVRFGVNEKATVKLVAKVGSRVVARGSSRMSAAGKRTVTLKVPSSARRYLRRGAKVVVSATAKDGAGNVGRDSASRRY